MATPKTEVKKYAKGVKAGLFGAGFLVSILSIFAAGALLKLAGKSQATAKFARFVTEGYGV